MTSSFFRSPLAWLNASKTMPEGSAPSPMTATACRSGAPADLVADLEPQRRRGRAAGVPGHEQVERALGRVGVAHQAPLGPDRVQTRGAAGDQLVGIDLVAGVPDQAVLGEVEAQVQAPGRARRRPGCWRSEPTAGRRRRSTRIASRRQAARARHRTESLRSAGDWILPSTESGWFINDPFPKEPAPGL